MSRQDWEARYQENDLPWDTGEPEAELVHVVANEPIAPCPALEVGCGTGTNLVWLAEQGFSVCGVDVSATAIETVRGKLSAAGVQGDAHALDFLTDAVPGAPFGFAFDRGCFHSFDTAEERKVFAESMAAHLAPGGLWFSLIGSADDPPRDTGPPRRSALDIVAAVEPYFEILELKTTLFNVTRPQRPRAWRCLMRRREA